ncbi:MAG TPA: hypothetical protein VGK67_39750 [Myxococcales bacterium]|jgi:hypothetical protein
MPDKSVKVAVISQEQLRKLAEFVLSESAAGEVRSTLNIGRYLFLQIFRGSEEAFRSKDSNKPDSLNDLAAQPGMAEAKWSRSRLRNVIEIALMAKVHNDFRAWRTLRVSHLEEVIGLPAEMQRELLDRAGKERWSVLRLKQAAGKQKPLRPVPEPGSVTPGAALGRLRKAMGQFASVAALAPCLLEVGIDAKKVAELTASAEEGLRMLKGFQERIEKAKKRSGDKLKRVAGKVAVPG